MKYIDDFYLPLKEQKRDELGGNIDFSRFKKEVIENINNDITYSIFDCSVQKITDKINLKKKKLLKLNEG